MKTLLALFGAAFLLAGCASVPGPLPRGAEKVGGGLAIEWRAPRSGTAILYDAVNSRIVTTRSLDAGEYFRFPNDASDEHILEAFYGESGEPAKARFELFFASGVTP